MPELREQLQRTIGDNYTLERELGGGGMSRVFLAEETSLGRKVVVKVLPPELAAAVNLERFRREIQLAAKLQHPHIVPVLAAGISEGLPYYTMPFIEGESLRTRIAHVGPLPVNETVKILRDTLSALSYAHEHGVVHRDIKPDNILISDQHAVVADFGVAKALSASTNPGASLTSLGVALGTPAYMSPEQAGADPTTDGRADLYAVGAVAYEMLTGQQVFSARSPQAMLAAHMTEIPEPLQKRRPSVPPALASLIMRALEKYAADRPQTAREMLAQLDAAVTPSGATTPTGMLPARPARAPKRIALLIGGGATLLLVVGLSGWYLYRGKPAVAVADANALVADKLPTLGVVPFENLGNQSDAYFADGMTDEISSRLGNLSGLRVIGRQSMRGYANSTKTVPQIGKELGATYILTGTVRWDRSGAKSRVRVSPALLRTTDGTAVWSEPYEDQLTGVFQLQTRVAERVVQALQLHLTSNEQQTLAIRPTENLEAYDAYLRGAALIEGSSSGPQMVRASKLLEHATRLDPKFALAFAALGRAHTEVYWDLSDVTPGRLKLAKAALDSALKLSPDLPAAHNAMGNYWYHGFLDYDRALAEFATTTRLAPKDPIAYSWKARVERRQGKMKEAIADYQRAISLDPRNGDNVQDLAQTYLMSRDYESAEEEFARAVAIDPPVWDSWQYYAQNTVHRSGDVKRAVAILLRAAPTVDPDQLGWLLLLRASAFPAFLNPELATAMRDARAPSSEPADKLLFFAGKQNLALYEHDAAGARAAADSIVRLAPKVLNGGFLDADFIGPISMAYVVLGDSARGLQEMRRIVARTPISRDAIRGTDAYIALGYAAAVAGNADEAIAAFSRAVSFPSYMSRNYLRVDPLLAPLRKDPRFQRFLSEK
jgi:eukaryotic-like serine/threonine-protein kinase